MCLSTSANKTVLKFFHATSIQEVLIFALACQCSSREGRSKAVLTAGCKTNSNFSKINKLAPSKLDTFLVLLEKINFSQVSLICALLALHITI